MRWSLLGAWLIVTVVATGLTWQIVSAADEQVNDRPVAPLQVNAPTTAASSPGSAAPAPVTPSTPNTTADSASSTTSPGSATTTAPSGSSTSTTSGGSTSTSTPGTSSPSGQPSGSEMIVTGGGSIRVAYEAGAVSLVAATPAPGFAAEVDKQGPPDVDVEFESDLTKIRVRVRWDDGNLDIDVSDD